MKAKTLRRPRKPSNLADRMRREAIIDPKNRPVVKAVRRTLPNIESDLNAMEERCKIPGLVPKAAETLAWIAEARENIHTEDWMKRKGEVAIAASRGDKEAADMLAAAVVTTTENIVNANSGWASFFETSTLAEDDYPAVQGEVMGQAITVDSIGQDGGNVTVRAQLDSPDPVFLPIHLRSTPWLEYPLFDLYKGSSVKSAALAQFDVARDRAWRKETLLGSYLIVGGANTRLIATFVTTGALAARDYFAESRVNTGNLPVGNLITLAGNTTTSLFRKEVFDAIIKYCRSWGDNVMEGGNLRPVELRVASLHVTDFLAQVNLTSVSNMVNEQIFATGALVSYAGQTFIISGDNSIDPNLGMCYVRTDKPIGIAYDKPSADKVILDDSKVLESQNLARVCEIWAESFAMPLHWRKRTLGICYKTAV